MQCLLFQRKGGPLWCRHYSYMMIKINHYSLFKEKEQQISPDQWMQEYNVKKQMQPSKNECHGITQHTVHTVITMISPWLRRKSIQHLLLKQQGSKMTLVLMITSPCSLKWSELAKDLSLLVHTLATAEELSLLLSLLFSQYYNIWYQHWFWAEK